MDSTGSENTALGKKVTATHPNARTAPSTRTPTRIIVLALRYDGFEISMINFKRTSRFVTRQNV